MAASESELAAEAGSGGGGIPLLAGIVNELTSFTSFTSSFDFLVDRLIFGSLES